MVGFPMVYLGKPGVLSRVVTVYATTYEPPEWRTAAGELHLIIERQIWHADRSEMAVRTVHGDVLQVTAEDMRSPDAPPCEICTQHSRTGA